jgi:hypothetical protein
MDRHSVLLEPRAVPIRLAEADDLLLDAGNAVRCEAVEQRLGPAELESANDVHDT